MIRLKLSLAVLIAVFLMFPAIVQAQVGGVCGTQVSVAPTTAEEGQPVTVTIDVHDCTGRSGLVQKTVDVTPTVSACAPLAETFWVGGQIAAYKSSVFTHTFPAPQCVSTYNVSFNGTVRATLTVATVTTTSLTLKVTSPMNNSTVTNPVHIAATASGPNPISQIQVWVNYKEVFHVSGGTLNANVTLPVGSGERFVVQAVDSKGNIAKVIYSITVVGTRTTAKLSPASLSFGSVTVGSSGGFPRTATLTNVGTATLAITGITITGTNARDFVVTQKTCGSSLSAGASCTVNIRFEPTASGTRTASLNVSDNAAGSPQKVALSGTGVGHLTLDGNCLHPGLECSANYDPTQCPPGAAPKDPGKSQCGFPPGSANVDLGRSCNIGFCETVPGP